MENNWETIKQKKTELLKKELEIFIEKLNQVHVGRLSLEVIGEKIKLDFQGKKKSLKSLVNLSISPAHELVVSDCEPKMVSLIKTAILNNQLGYEFELVKKPVEKNNSNQIYFALTLITKEKRDRFIQRAKKIAEEGRVTLNQIREKFRNLVKKEKSFSQDQKRNYEKQIDNLTKDYENKLMEAKEKKVRELSH